MTVYGADKRHHTLTVLVENKAGVLARVAGLFSRRGYNIFSLAVAPSTTNVQPDHHRGGRGVRPAGPDHQAARQAHPVVSITELDPSVSRERELLMATLEAGPDTGARSSSWSGCSRARSSTSATTV